MSGYVRETKFEMTFDGDQVRALLSPLKLIDAMAFNAAIGTKEAPGRMDDLIATFQRVLPDYVKQFSGLHASDGSEIGIAEVVEITYFTSVIKELGMTLLRASRVTDPKRPVVRSNGASAGASPSTETPSVSPESVSTSG